MLDGSLLYYTPYHPLTVILITVCMAKLCFNIVVGGCMIIQLHAPYLIEQRSRLRPSYVPPQVIIHRQEPMSHTNRIREELKSVGLKYYGLHKLESYYLPKVIHPNEHIHGAVHGKAPDGSAMLVATDHRVLFVDKKFLFARTDEVTYDVIGGVTMSSVGPLATVTLHTRLGDFSIRTMNIKAAQVFVDYIEVHCLEHEVYQRKFTAQ